MTVAFPTLSIIIVDVEQPVGRGRLWLRRKPEAPTDLVTFGEAGWVSAQVQSCVWYQPNTKNGYVLS